MSAEEPTTNRREESIEIKVFSQQSVSAKKQNWVTLENLGVQRRVLCWRRPRNLFVFSGDSISKYADPLTGARFRAWASELATSENSVKCSRDSFDTLLCFQEIKASDRASDFA